MARHEPVWGWLIVKVGNISTSVLFWLPIRCQTSKTDKPHLARERYDCVESPDDHGYWIDHQRVFAAATETSGMLSGKTHVMCPGDNIMVIGSNVDSSKDPHLSLAGSHASGPVPHAECAFCKTDMDAWRIS